MRNREPRYPGRIKLTPVVGQADTFDLARADEPTEEGDALSKETFLQDATAAAYGLGTEATPDEVLGKLKESVLYRSGTLKNVLGSNITIPATQLSERVRIATGSYTGTGTFGEGNPTTLSFGLTPKFVIVHDSAFGFYNNAFSSCFLWSFGVKSVDVSYSGSSYPAYVRFNQIYDRLSWYSLSMIPQLNYLGSVYSYMAIG